MGVECFVIQIGEESRRSLRRYCKDRRDCPERSYHNATVPLGEHALVRSDDGAIDWIDPDSYLTHPAWPTHCSCGYEFTEADERQVNQDPIYVALDGRGEWTLSEAPPGAMWEAWWVGDWARVNGGAGPAWVFKLPNGAEFMPGQGASNCDRKGEDHDCWCVHGEAPMLTIDKTPEPGRSTCTAGGGSIWSRQGQPNDWHGFVTAGELVG